LEKLEPVGVLQVLLEVRSHPVMHLALEAMEQPVAVAVAVDIGVEEVVAPTAVAVVGPHSLMQVYSAWCIRRRIR
jgi:hypothetical protein